MNKFKQWYFKPTHWWRFWLPELAIIGGLIIGILIIIAFGISSWVK